MFDVDEEGVIDHLDIVNHIIADKGLRKPSTYRESFEILSEERLIPKVLSDRLSDLAGFRNEHISSTYFRNQKGVERSGNIYFVALRKFSASELL